MKEQHQERKLGSGSWSLGVLLAVLLIVLPAAVRAAQNTNAFSPSVWDGVFTAEQAGRGQIQFLEHCAHCHGGELQGTAEAKSLKGQRFWTDWKESSVDYMLERISQSMPFSEDGSLAGTLPARTYADIVAHLLNTNGFPAGSRELTAESAANVKIVTKDGPGELPATTLVRIVGCLTKAADGWHVVKASVPARTRSGASAPAANNPSTPLGSREFALKFVLTPLDKYANNRVAVTGLLIGEGGKEGLNLTSITTIAPACE